MLPRWWPAVGLAIGLGVGVATSYLQGVVPGSWNTLANSGAVWTVIAFGVAAALVTTPATTVATGLTTLLGEVFGYYAIAAHVRGIATSSSERILWVVAAIVIGPLAGVAAWLVRRGRPSARAAAALAVCGVVAGEGVHGVLRVSSSSAAAWTEIVVAGAVAIVVLAMTSAALRARVAALLVGALVALVVVAVYGETALR
jgi:hypothetical protein